MQLSGKLEKFDFSDILQMLSRSAKSGRLALTQRGGQGVIVLRRGRIIYAASSAVRETLGNILLCRGLVSREELEKGLRLQQKAHRERRLGTILVELGLVSQEELRLVVREQVEKVVLEMLGWHSGYFRFDELDLADCGEVAIDALDFIYTDGLPADEMLLELSVKLDEEIRAGATAAPELRSESDPAPAKATAAGSGDAGAPTRLSAIMTETPTPEFTAEITLSILTYAQRLVRRCVLFRCSPLGFAGMGQFGVELPSGGAADFVRKVVLPLGQPSILTEAVVRKAVFRGPLEATAVNRNLLRSLGGGWPAEAVAGPLLVSGRVLLILYGDNLPSADPIGDLEGLGTVLLDAGLAMEKSSLAKRQRLLEGRQRP